MFNDRNSEDNEDQHENDELKRQMEQIEKEFFEALEKNNDISLYLYLPPNFLSQRVRDELDKYLMEQAYVNMFIMKNAENFVYRDGFVDIGVEDSTKKLEMLENMLSYFAEKEEYEKCATIRDEIENINRNQ